jgi:hypothetical protein
MNFRKAKRVTTTQIQKKEHYSTQKTSSDTHQWASPNKSDFCHHRLFLPMFEFI